MLGSLSNLNILEMSPNVMSTANTFSCSNTMVFQTLMPSGVVAETLLKSNEHMGRRIYIFQCNVVGRTNSQLQCMKHHETL